MNGPLVLLHIPHASTLIPGEYAAGYLAPPDELARQNLLLADLYTDELYQLPGAERAVFPVSRFLVDAERFSNDGAEPMAARGMGVLYEVTVDLQPLREKPDDRLRNELLDRYYWPHHAAMDRWADGLGRVGGRGLLIDCHSFPSRALPYELETRNDPRPEICIGTDPFHTGARLRDATVAWFRDKGYWVEVDTPFRGALTPNNHYRRNAALQAIMIEVRKDLYMDEATGGKAGWFDEIRDDLTAAMRVMCATLDLTL